MFCILGFFYWGGGGGFQELSYNFKTFHFVHIKMKCVCVCFIKPLTPIRNAQAAAQLPICSYYFLLGH